MPLGLYNASNNFERLIGSVLYEACVVYLDDVIVVGRMFQEQLDNLRGCSRGFKELAQTTPKEVPTVSECGSVTETRHISSWSD
jgi:hypothetical protein